MATGINITQLSEFNPIELDDIKKVVAERFWTSPEFNKIFTVFEGYDKKTQLVLADELGLSGILDSQGARPESGDFSMGLTEKFVNTVLIGDTKKHTQLDLNKDFKMVVRKSAKDYTELSETEQIAVYITEKAIKYMEEARYRLAMLGDTAADTSTNGGYLIDSYTSAGSSVNMNKKLFNPINGFWKQAQTGVGASKTGYAKIDENYKGTQALQLALASTTGFNAVKAIYDNAPNDLKGMPDKYIMLTSGLYQNYVDYLASGALSGGGLTELIINGIKTPAYMGVPVMEDGKTSNTLLKYQVYKPKTQLNGAITSGNKTSVTVDSTDGFPDSGTIKIGTTPDYFVYTSKTATTFVGASQAIGNVSDDAAVELNNVIYNQPHRGFMTTVSNMGCYTLSIDDISNIESFYDKVTRVNYFAYDFLIDVVIGREELVSVAY